MNGRPSMIATPRFHRSKPEAPGPERGAGGLMRTAGAGIAGVPLDSLEAVAVAAVRTGYRVADAHILRVQELGQRLRGAGEAAVGAEPEMQALEAVDSLISQSVLAGVGLLEGAAAEPGGPLHRFLAAQVRLFAGARGLGGAAGPPPAASSAREPPAAEPPRRRASASTLSIRHLGEVRRRVLVVDCELRATDRATTFERIAFFHAQELDASPLTAAVRATTTGPILELDVERNAPAGLWNAAVCTDDGTQVGWIQIEI